MNVSAVTGVLSKNCQFGLYSQARDFHQEKVMPTETKPEATVRSFGENVESDLAPKFLRVVEKAAIASARTMGQGDRKLADHVATEAMRATMDTIPMRGTIVIGEGERDEAPMLYIGEKVGASFPDGTAVPEVDIAVDPLEGTNLCATGAAGSITVLAASEKGGLLNAPDCYMEKIVVGPSCKGAVELDAPVAENLKNIAKRLDRDVEDLVVIVLDRPRHEKLINDIRAAGARIRLISDGDLSAGIAAAVVGTGVHAVMGSGGAPEGVITAAAIRCLNGYMLGRLVINKPELEERIRRMGIADKNKIYTAEDLAPGKQLIFAATGVTEGALMKGVRFFGEGTRTSSVIFTKMTGKVRFIESIHLEKKPDVKVRFA
jgi:fructose-1,6-bisphosphatase II